MATAMQDDSPIPDHYTLIDPPVSHYSSPEEVKAWIKSLRDRPQDDQVREAIRSAESLLKVVQDQK